MDTVDLPFMALSTPRPAATYPNPQLEPAASTRAEQPKCGYQTKTTRCSHQPSTLWIIERVNQMQEGPNFSNSRVGKNGLDLSKPCCSRRSCRCGAAVVRRESGPRCAKGSVLCGCGSGVPAGHGVQPTDVWHRRGCSKRRRERCVVVHIPTTPSCCVWCDT